jgi:crossover junction endodeoxyribonuclease RuvC
VLGIDPGSAASGWALVLSEGNRYRLVEYGVVRPRGNSRAERLADLARRLSEITERLAPDCAAVESSFTGRNPKSALALAEARGVVLATLGRKGMEVFPYSPAEIKSAMVGHGTAEKHQVAFMVVRLLGLSATPPADAADAAAVALTHLHGRRLAVRR